MTEARITADPKLIGRAADLRHRVFVQEQGVDEALESDGRDDAATHVVLERQGEIVGTARIFDAGDAAVVGRVAIAAERRGQGLGALVMQVAERWAADSGLLVVELHAQEPVIGFYERLGYAGVGGRYLEAGIPHLTMRKQLLPGLRPVRDEDAVALQTLVGSIWGEYPGVVLDVDAEEPWMRAPATYYASGSAENGGANQGGENQGGELWVLPAADGEGLVASAGWRPHPEGAELKTLYVAATCRRQGLGSRLVRFIERRVGGREQLRAWSDTRFVEAHVLYERLGYLRSGRSRELHDLSDTTEIEFVGRPAAVVGEQPCCA